MEQQQRGRQSKKKKWKVPLPNGRDVAVTDIINETLFDVGDDELEENWQLSPQPSDVLVITREGGWGTHFCSSSSGFLVDQQRLQPHPHC